MIDVLVIFFVIFGVLLTNVFETRTEFRLGTRTVIDGILDGNTVGTAENAFQFAKRSDMNAWFLGVRDRSVVTFLLYLISSFELRASV